MVRKRIWVLASVTFLLLVALFLLNVVRDRNLDHDEHQFVASAVLLVQDGLLPYRDYPYFHVPNLLFLYAFLFRFSDFAGQVSEYYFLTARLFTVLCEWLLMVTLFFVAWHRFGKLQLGRRFLLAAGTVLFLLSNPLFLYTSGIAWNHALPVLLTVWAFLIHSNARTSPHLFLSGLLIGSAIGTRLSFAPLVLPFVLILFLNRTDKEFRPPLGHPFYQSVLYMAGVGVALLPTLWTFLLAPEQFLFGTIEYAALNTLYRGATDFGRAMTLTGKINYLFSDVIFFERGGNFVFLLTFLLLVVLPMAKRVWLGEEASQSFSASLTKSEFTFLWLLLPFLLLGALAPTPTQLQYFYPLVPFMLLIILYTVTPSPRHLPSLNPSQLWEGSLAPSLRYLFLLGVILSLLTSNIPRYYNLLKLQKLRNWTPIELHERGEQVARLTNKQKVLTLAPIIPLEGGSPIYKAFATGPFAWRVTKFLPQDVRQRQGMVGDEELPALVADDPPRAILVGVEPDEAKEEVPLIDYAQTHAYTALKLADDEILWLSSLADWGGAIRLAAVELPTKALAPGENFQLLFYLQNIAPIEKNLNVLVRFVGQDEQELLRSEGWPYGSPTSAWPLEEIWRDGHELSIPQEALPGTYRVELTFYDPATFEHLPALNPITGEAIGETLVVGEIVVGE